MKLKGILNSGGVPVEGEIKFYVNGNTYNISS